MISLKSFVLTLSCIVLVNCFEYRKDGWFKKCPQVKPVSQIDLKLYSGVWYLTQISENGNQGDTSCNKLNHTFISDQRIGAEYAYLSSDMKPVSQKIEEIYDAKRPGVLTTTLSPNPILSKWYGKLNFQILDIDYSSHYLVYVCYEQFFGLKTEESLSIAQRSLAPLDASVQYNLNNLVKSFDYGGAPLEKISHNPILCKGL